MTAKIGTRHFFASCKSTYVGNAGKRGRGVFAAVDIPEGELFDTVPVIVIKLNEDEDTYFDEFIYEWGDGSYALALGFGSLFNHSSSPTAGFDSGYTKGQPCIEYYALKDISKGEEILINYHGDPDCKDKWSFE